MRLHWFGHAAFLVESARGERVIIDPYSPARRGDDFALAEIAEPADVVLVSHTHSDHFGADAVLGDHETLTEAGSHSHGALHFLGVPSSHDSAGGAQRGANLMWLVEADDLRVLHCGDLGEPVTDEHLRLVERVDVLLVPVGGVYTLDARGAHAAVARFAPRVVIPMHYRTDKVRFGIADVEPFLMTNDPVVRLDAADLYLSAHDLPALRTIYVLRPSR